MPASDGFVVMAKGRALNNDVVRGRFVARGQTQTFDDRAAAESFAERATWDGDVRVVVQASAPQDDACDAYLVAIPARNVTAPANPDDEYWRFHTEANQQGAIGEVLATTPATNPPALTHHVREDLGHPDGLVVRVDRDAPAVGGWRPDCVARALVDGSVVRAYYCEVKTGNASFQRDQRAGMDRIATGAATTSHDATVLSVRVHIDDLPDEYDIAVREYDPDA